MSRPDVLMWRCVGVLFGLVGALCFMNVMFVRGHGAPADAAIVCAIFAIGAWRTGSWMGKHGGARQDRSPAPQERRT